MDPNACLNEMLDLADKMCSDYEDFNGNGIDQDEANRLAQLVDDLDDWIVKGGFCLMLGSVKQLVNDTE